LLLEGINETKCISALKGSNGREIDVALCSIAGSNVDQWAKEMSLHR
jgi:hypothetical protein